MSKTLSALLIDLDGTLADSLHVMQSVYKQFLARFTVQPSEAEFQKLNGPPLLDIVRYLKAQHSLPGDERSLLLQYEQLIDGAYQSVKPALGAESLLKMAKKHSYAIAVVTSNTYKRAEAWLKITGLQSYITCIIAGDRITQGKPHAEPYLLALKELVCLPSCAVAIEDSKQGAQSAIAAGVNTFMLMGKNTDVGLPEKVNPIKTLEDLIGLLW